MILSWYCIFCNLICSVEMRTLIQLWIILLSVFQVYTIREPVLNFAEAESVVVSTQIMETKMQRWLVARAGHVPTFLKSFRSVLERGPSARSFRSRSFFFNLFRSRSVLSHSDGIVLNCFVRSCERTIVPQERRPALLVARVEFNNHTELHIAVYQFNNQGVYFGVIFYVVYIIVPTTTLRSRSSCSGDGKWLEFNLMSLIMEYFLS